MVRHMPFHAAGTYSRNNGEKVGVNRGGPQNEYMHPSCALEVKETKKGATCSSCLRRVDPGWHFITRLGSAQARCTPSASGHRWLHGDCVRRLIHRHRTLLMGHIGVRQQFEETVCWPGLMDPNAQRDITSFFKPASRRADRTATLQTACSSQTLVARRPLPRSNRVLPGCDAVLASLRATLSGFSDVEEEEAAQRHRALQERIRQALAKDAALAKERPNTKRPAGADDGAEGEQPRKRHSAP